MTSAEAWGSRKGDGIDQSLLKPSTLWDLGRLMLPPTHPLTLTRFPSQGEAHCMGFQKCFTMLWLTGKGSRRRQPPGPPRRALTHNLFGTLHLSGFLNLSLMQKAIMADALKQ